MRSLLAVLAAVALAGSATAPAVAKPVAKPKAKAVCKLLVDPAGDASDAIGTDPGFDVLSADVATDRYWAAFAIRLREVPPVAPHATGFEYEVSIQAKDFRLVAWIVRGTVGDYTTVYARRPLAPGIEQAFWIDEPVTKFDAARREIRVSVPLANLSGDAGRIRPGERLTALTVTTRRIAGGAGGMVGVLDPARVPISDLDTATSRAAYVAGSASCLRPGS